MSDKLTQASEWLRSEDNLSPLALVVRRQFPGATVFPIESLPERGEDIHGLLIDPDKVARIEIHRECPEMDVAGSIEMIDLQTYRTTVRSKNTRRMLDAAVDFLGGPQ
ncbi:hypothetical protein N5I87_06110 [Ralstonia sp. CHL-2022]|uniref:Uncharacterized protein n=1 Tax=Ralstonia mojiangensis TaxID=2953895 RepID=A0AAE3I0Z3_9RALS|nr:hypothetical protein [Ralstonia mojiangensis]MCT7315571.1 hypothetical protein [Ralstonia mojiangensis]